MFAAMINLSASERLPSYSVFPLLLPTNYLNEPIASLKAPARLEPLLAQGDPRQARTAIAAEAGTAAIAEARHSAKPRVRKRRG
jgi:hypothetical protein